MGYFLFGILRKTNKGYLGYPFGYPKEYEKKQKTQVQKPVQYFLQLCEQLKIMSELAKANL